MTTVNLPATSWKLRTRSLEFGAIPALMGIVNVTPDSFSDGGHFFSVNAAVDHALQLAADGAAILDVGGESTRPYADPVSEREELRRVLPVIQQLQHATDAVISIDTYKPQVAKEAVAAGAEIINDVSGLRDEAMVRAAVETDAGVCVMHMRETPATMQNDPVYADVVAEVAAYLASRRTALIAAGVAPQRICLDPGVGFGKTHEHNLQLLAHCDKLHALESPVLIGHSRKGFIANVIGDKETDRTPGVIGVAAALMKMRVQVLRVHDVAAVQQALQLFDAVWSRR